jgi:hypothetical protein
MGFNYNVARGSDEGLGNPLETVQTVIDDAYADFEHISTNMLGEVIP